VFDARSPIGRRETSPETQQAPELHQGGHVRPSLYLRLFVDITLTVRLLLQILIEARNYTLKAENPPNGGSGEQNVDTELIEN
jgi:hypothetical protein